MASAYKKRESRSGYFFTLPALLVVFSLIIYPLGYAIFISTQRTNLISEWEFVGARYYLQLLTDPEFLNSLRISLVFAFFVVVGNFVVGLLLAVILNQKIKFATFFKIILMLPWLLPEVVVALIWKWLFNPTYGLINYILNSIGIIDSDVSWFDSSASALAGVIFVAVWKGYPIVMIMMLAGMKNIPQERYEAAAVDGASRLQQFRHITLPGLRPIFLVTLILETAWWFKHFTIIWLMTSGGPAGATKVVSIDIYQQAFANFNFGLAAAESVIILSILLAASYIYSRAIRDDND
jgi:ABC-type sugar transport system permease subunit